MKAKSIKTLVSLILGASSAAVLATGVDVPMKPIKGDMYDEKQHGIETHQHGTETVQHREPLKAVAKQLDSYKQQNTVAQKVEASADCDLNQFKTNNSQQLINAIETQGTECINLIFGADAQTQSEIYSSGNMLTAASRAQTLSSGYTGGGDEDIESYFLFLRAGFYVEFYNDSVTFSSNVQPAVKAAIDQFVNNSYYYSDNDSHGKTLSEVHIAMDSAELQHEYLPQVKSWLNRWNQSYASKWYMRSAVNNLFTLLFRGQWNTEFSNLVSSDRQLVSALRSFTMDSWMIGSDADFMINNAGAELGRLLNYGGSIQPDINSGLSDIFSTYETFGYGDGVWLRAADMVSYYSDCSSFGICGYKAEVESKALSQSHSCSSTIKIRSQNMTSAQFQSACAKMAEEETRFHNMLETNNQPVSDDYNSFLQVNIFDSDTDYQKYAGVIFGISTNNGGMYLEGDPSVPGNQANFVAYEASYANPDHYVWNLEHEYVHYLDGRFNLYGDFNAPTEAIVWWSEGSAEYVSQLDDNQAAIDTILDGSTYSLSEVFETTYSNGNTDRIYRWGYLATRFMFERHPDKLQDMLAQTRAGNWSQYKSLVNGWVSSYSSEFTQWTQQLANQDPTNQDPVANANGPYAGTTNQAVAFSSAGSSDADGSIVSYSWSFGDGASANTANPSHSYSAAGQYNATLAVTDDDGATSSESVIVTITDGQNGNTLTNGEAVTVSGAQDSETTYQLDVPQNATSLVFNINGGSGDADLYIKYGAEPTRNDFDCRPYRTGNSETCEVRDIKAGTYYVMIRGYNSFNGVSLTGTYETSEGNVPNACSTQSPITSGTLQDGLVECLGSQDTIWLSLGNVSGQNSVAISTGNGSGDLKIEYSNSGWPSGNNVDAVSDNAGNNECIYVTGQSQYWGYLKVSGQASNASIVVDYNASGCR